MKTAFLAITFLAATAFAVATTPEETSLRKNLQTYGADYCYRFTSWSENPRTPQFVIAFYFFRMPSSKDRSVSAYKGGIPLVARAIATIENTNQKGTGIRTLQLDAKAAAEMICRFGYSGFFATDAIDPSPEHLDGHGLIGERLYSDEYVTKTRLCEDHLSCKWLFEYFEKYSK